MKVILDPSFVLRYNKIRLDCELDEAIFIRDVLSHASKNLRDKQKKIFLNSVVNDLNISINYFLDTVNVF